MDCIHLNWARGTQYYNILLQLINVNSKSEYELVLNQVHITFAGQEIWYEI